MRFVPSARTAGSPEVRPIGRAPAIPAAKTNESTTQTLMRQRPLSGRLGILRLVSARIVWLAAATALSAFVAACAPSAASPSASSSPTAPPRTVSPATSSAASTPSVTAHPSLGSPSPADRLFDDRFGLVVFDPGGGGRGGLVSLRLTNEGITRDLAVIEDRMGYPTTSPDGSLVAYWSWAADDPQRSPDRLVIARWSAPGARTAVLTLAGESGTGVAWAADGTGLVLGVKSREFLAPSSFDSPPAWVAVRTIDIATGTVREVMRTTNRADSRDLTWSILPLSWERVSGVIAAFERGPGTTFAYAYDAIRERGGVARTRLLDEQWVIGPASPDARRIAGQRSERRSLTAWPVETFGPGPELRGAADDWPSGAWHPGSTKLAVVVSGALRLWDTRTGDSTVLSISAALANTRPILFRPDGQALLLAGAAGTRDIFDIASGTFARVVQPSSGAVLAWVEIEKVLPTRP